MVTPYRDRGINVLYNQLEDEHPGIVIGWIGNKAHQAEKSDHNPSTEAHDRGAVDAIDPMYGPHYTIVDGRRDINSIIASRDPRVAYIISEGHIISSTVDPWHWRIYNGKDDHTNHWHLSVNDLHETDTSLWAIYKGDTMSATDATNGFMAVLAQAANASLPDGDPRREKDDKGKELPTTQVGRNALIFLRRILSPMLAADNDALVKAVIDQLPTGAHGSFTLGEIESAVRNVLRTGVDGTPSA